MSNNRNNNSNKKQNKYIKFLNDMSNNDLFAYNKEDLYTNRNFIPFDESNTNNYYNNHNLFNKSILDNDNLGNYQKIKPLEISKTNKSSICKKTTDLNLDLDINNSITNINKLLVDTDKYLKSVDDNYPTIKLLDNNTHNEKNNIKSFLNYNKMNPIKKNITLNKINPLISALDDSSINLYNNFENKKDKNIEDKNRLNEIKKIEDKIKYYEDENKKLDDMETDILLKFILKQYDEEFKKNYSSPYFSGMDILPVIPEHSPKSTENIKNIIKEKIFIEASVENLLDLIDLCDKYPLADNVEYNINMKSLHNIKPSLLELQNMIGMSSIKENIVDQILYFIQDLHNVSSNNADYMHAVIYGPPGTGKTEVAKIMGKIFSNLGILKKNVFKKVTRDDLVAGYLGQTAIKTKEVIKECIGGVLFIDEAYALGNKEKKDSFSKECIDIICEALSDHKKDLMCIIAGYETELKDCFFSYNPGLESRFTWKFNIDEYNHSELKQIFEKMIKECGWKLKEPLDDIWFEKNKDFFKFYGRDMETLFSKVKIAHSRRIFGLPNEEKTQINMKDLEKGFDIYKKMGDSEKKKNEAERLKQLHNTMYC